MLFISPNVLICCRNALAAPEPSEWTKLKELILRAMGGRDIASVRVRSLPCDEARNPASGCAHHRSESAGVRTIVYRMLSGFSNKAAYACACCALLAKQLVSIEMARSLRMYCTTPTSRVRMVQGGLLLTASYVALYVAKLSWKHIVEVRTQPPRQVPAGVS